MPKNTKTKKVEKFKPNWNLDHIIPLGQFDTLYKSIEKDILRLRSIRKKLTPYMSEKQFVEFIKFDEALTEKVSRLYDRASLMESADEKSQTAKMLKEKAKDLYIRVGNEFRPISHWLKGKEVDGFKLLDDENAKRLFKSVPDLEYNLNYDREAAKHTLSEPEEKIILEKSATGEHVLTDLRELVETEFTYKFKPQGEKEKEIKTRSELISHTHSEKATHRKAAYISLLSKYRDNIDKFFMIYQAIVKNWASDSKRRGFPSPISMRNHANHVSDKTITTLLEVCTKNKELFQNYFRFKAKELSMKKLSRFDVYAPLSKSSSKIPLKDGIKLVLETFEEFSPRFRKFAEAIINSNHIDYYPRPEKRDGAFCATVTPKITPYILMNYTGKSRDVSTLAHELGHGIHSLYASHLPPSAQHASLPLAETASTLGEMVLFEKLLAREKNSKTKKAMLSEKIADSYATILRQNYFVKFEILAHEKIPQGITAEDLSNLWLQTLKEQFGDSITIDPLFKYEWANIPHIVNTPFYCYAYNFGELLSLSLFKRYKDEGKSFVPKIEKILSYGGSEDPAKVLKEIGIDISSPSFWQGGFEVIKEWQKLLSRL